MGGGGGKYVILGGGVIYLISYILGWGKISDM